MKQRILFVGLSGVGKSTILDQLEQLAKSNGAKISFVNYGSLMMDLAEKSISDRDDIRKASHEFQHELQSKAADKVLQSSSNDQVVVVDTHLLVKTASGYLPGIPDDVLSRIKPDLIVLLEAPVEDIVHRRASDRSRKRGDM
ncbi:MAG: AAA family ATPase, partial [Candidatus Bathyarchaeia archaeon]